jgi:DNA-binding NarL/FixJ family response regulator
MMIQGSIPAKVPRILLVDDHQVVRSGLATILKTYWDVCGEAASGDDAVEKLLELKPDVVILDFRMPGKGGAATARAIRHRAPETKIIMFSMYEDEAMAQVAKLAGADAYVNKRQPSADLVKVIKSLIESPLPDQNPDPGQFEIRRKQFFDP